MAQTGSENFGLYTYLFDFHKFPAPFGVVQYHIHLSYRISASSILGRSLYQELEIHSKVLRSWKANPPNFHAKQVFPTTDTYINSIIIQQSHHFFDDPTIQYTDLIHTFAPTRYYQFNHSRTTSHRNIMFRWSTFILLFMEQENYWANLHTFPFISL